MSVMGSTTSKKAVSPSPAIVPPRVPVTDFAVHPDGQPDEMDFLKQIESILIRMLIGVFRFPFVRLPRLIFQIMTQVSPTFVAISKITLLASLLLIIVCTPALYAWFFDEVNLWLKPRMASQVIDQLTTYQLLVRTGCYSMSTILGIGAAWGAIYLPIRRRLRNRNERLKKAAFAPVVGKTSF